MWKAIKFFFSQPINFIIILLALLAGLATFSGFLVAKIHSQRTIIDGYLAAVEYDDPDDRFNSELRPMNSLTSSLEQAQQCLKDALTKFHPSSMNSDTEDLEKDHANCLRDKMTPPYGALYKLGLGWRKLPLQDQFILSARELTRKAMLEKLKNTEETNEMNAELLSQCETNFKQLKSECKKTV